MNFVSIRRVMDMPAPGTPVSRHFVFRKAAGRAKSFALPVCRKESYKPHPEPGFFESKTKVSTCPSAKKGMAKLPPRHVRSRLLPFRKEQKISAVGRDFLFCGRLAGAVSWKRPKPCLPDEKTPPGWAEFLIYLVPKMRSPASPRPGTM